MKNDTSKLIEKNNSVYTEPIKILIVDDIPNNHKPFKIMLQAPHRKIMSAMSGEEAIAILKCNDIALILMDIQMPGIDGYKTVELIKGNIDTKHIPIIFVTAVIEEKKNLSRGYECGVVDFLFKPFEPYILKSKVNIFLDLYIQKKIIENQNKELVKAKKRILDQQAIILEDERLKVLLEMAGATSHELNQPLMIMMGNIELMEMYNYDVEHVKKIIPKLKKSAHRIVDTVEKINNLSTYKTKVYHGKHKIVDIHNNVKPTPNL